MAHRQCCSLGNRAWLLKDRIFMPSWNFSPEQSLVQFLTGCGPEAPQISATGVSPQSSSQHGSCFPQSEGVRGGTQLIFYSLEASHLSQPHQWEGVKWGISASRQSIGGQLRGCHRRGEAKILSCHIKSIQPCPDHSMRTV